MKIKSFIKESGEILIVAVMANAPFWVYMITYNC